VCTFDAFGVTFGLFICFDSLFPQPALSLLQQGVRNFVFPTSWVGASLVVLLSFLNLTHGVLSSLLFSLFSQENIPQLLLSVGCNNARTRAVHSPPTGVRLDGSRAGHVDSTSRCLQQTTVMGAQNQVAFHFSLPHTIER
jgi:hypothetical protein